MPASSTLFGLYIDGLHRFLVSSVPVGVPVLSSGVLVLDLRMHMISPLWHEHPKDYSA